MTLCLQKKESIKSGTIGIYCLLKQWRKADKITEKDYKLALKELAKIEKCTNLEETFKS